VPAHVSLFHALPGERLPTVLEDLAAACARPPFAVDVTGRAQPGSRGRAPARVGGPALPARRPGRALGAVADPAGPQRFAAHVTVQNKVQPARARALLEQLSAGFVPWSATATGVHVWRYLGGPWEHAATVPLAG
jgi:hypothetical protein